MDVIITKRFYQKLDKQVAYISNDKPLAGRKFKNDILDVLANIDQPLKYKKSYFFDDENIREIIFKGYKIIFEIRKTKIVVFGFHKWENSLKL